MQSGACRLQVLRARQEIQRRCRPHLQRGDSLPRRSAAASPAATSGHWRRCRNAAFCPPQPPCRRHSSADAAKLSFRYHTGCLTRCSPEVRRLLTVNMHPRSWRQLRNRCSPAAARTGGAHKPVHLLGKDARLFELRRLCCQPARATCHAMTSALGSAHSGCA